MRILSKKCEKGNYHATFQIFLVFKIFVRRLLEKDLPNKFKECLIQCQALFFLYKNVEIDIVFLKKGQNIPHIILERKNTKIFCKIILPLGGVKVETL